MPPFTFHEARQILERTPATLRALLAGLGEPWLSSNEGPETWTPIDVVAHLTDLEETDWVTRARMILDEGEGRPFPPIDRVRFRTELSGRSMDELLRIFTERRAGNLRTMAELRLGPEHLARSGTHPTFGRVTLAQLLAAWAVHDLTHISQIVRLLAKHYAAEVGPWKAFLKVLRTS